MQLLFEANKGDNVVLARNEWERIKSSSEQAKKIDAEHQWLEAQEERKSKSNLISQDWPNKIVDLRKKRLEARKLREEKLEKERQELDVKEAQLQSERRKEIIENAKKQLYFQDERIRKLHGALLLCNVIKEREQQIELNKAKAHLFDDIEAKYLESMKKQEQEDLVKRKTRQEKNQKEKERLAVELIHQMKCKEELENQMKEELLKMRQELKKEDEKYVEELLRDLLDKQRHQKELLREQQKYRNEQKMIQDINRQKYLEECQKAEIYAEAKRKLSRMRDKKSKEKIIQRQDGLEKLREQIAQQFVKRLQDEDERYNKIVQEKEAKAVEEEEKRRLAKKQALEDCLSHYKIQMERHQLQNAAAGKAAVEELKKIREDYRQLEREILEKHQRQLEKQRRQHQILEQQIKEKRVKATTERAREVAGDLKHYDELRMDEEFFQEYAGKVLESIKEKGYHAILPLLRAAEPGIGSGRGPIYKERANIRPTYQASDISGAQLPHIVPLFRSESPTAERLGFQ